MKVTCPINPEIVIDSPLLDGIEEVKIQAALIKYCLDGGEVPADFEVHQHWFGRRGITIFSRGKDATWVLQL